MSFINIYTELSTVSCNSQLLVIASFLLSLKTHLILNQGLTIKNFKKIFDLYNFETKTGLLSLNYGTLVFRLCESVFRRGNPEFVARNPGLLRNTSQRRCENIYGFVIQSNVKNSCPI